MSTARRIPWSRVLVEGVVIVGSILLAFAIQAWWDDQNEQDAVETGLSVVVLEVEEELVELEDAIVTNLSRVSLFEEFLSLTPAELRALSEDSLDIISASFLPPRTIDGGGSALSSLLAGGSLSLIPDPKVRYALVEWGRVSDEIDEDYTISASVALRLQELAAARGLFFANSSYLRGEAYPGALSMSAAMSALRDDEEFVGVLAQLAREYVFFVDELRHLLPRFEHILAVTGQR